MKYALFLTLPLFALASCGGSSETEVMDTDGIEVPTVETPSVSDLGGDMVSVNETVDAVRQAGGDITAIDPAAATGVIDGWINKLGSVPGADGVVNNLQSLKGELTSGNIDGAKVGGILGQLASGTRSLAPNNPALGQLANALEAGATKLGGM